MTHSIALLARLALLSSFVLVGCEADLPASTATQPATQPAATNTAAAVAECATLAELDELDPRTPVPLQPMMAWHQKQNMQEHLVAIQRITDGLARSDWDEIIEAAGLIETSPQMQKMCEHMGAGAEGFTELALEFHHRADAIAEAARSQDATAVLTATSTTLLACTGCHAAYRQDLVDADTWAARTNSAHDPAAMHGR